MTPSLATPLLDGLEAFLRDDGWPVSRPPGPVPTVGTRCAGTTAEWECTGRTFEQKGQVVFDSAVPVAVPQEMGLALGLLLAAANWSLATGAFALDPATGQVRLRTSLAAGGPDLDPAAAKTLVYDNVLIVERCLPVLAGVAAGTLDLAQGLAGLEA